MIILLHLSYYLWNLNLILFLFLLINKNYGSGALSELRDLIQEYKNLENNFNEGGEEQEEEDEDAPKPDKNPK